jgi:hypothetical protein
MTSTGSRPFNSNSEQAKMWQLPDIVNVEAKRVRYDPPKQFWVNRQVLEVRDGLELLVQLTDALPSRALSPALYVGDIAVSDYEIAGPNLYRFFVIDPSALQPGARIALGWPQLPEAKLAFSNFRFQVRGIEGHV